MKKLCYLFSMLLGLFYSNLLLSQTGNVGINENGNLPNPAAMLDINSSTKGILIPRIDKLSDTTKITKAGSVLGISENGLMIYVLDVKQFYYWDGTKWIKAIGPQGPKGDMGQSVQPGQPGQ
jgi:hypothetical protein